jgi:butyryl-CoA dehydrogenase
MTALLFDDREIDFLLHDVLEAERLCELPAFREHGRETFELVLGAARRMAREVLWPTYRELDASPPVFEGGRVRVHPTMKTLWPKLVSLGLLAAPRPVDVGGQGLPLLVDTFAQAYLCAGNLGAAAWLILGRGTGHLVESFGSDELRRELMTRLYSGEWSGTMALTEPQAGSSLADVRTSATPTAGGHYLLRGSKIFISGGDHDVTENVVHLVLARVDGAPPGTKGISLFAVPKLRRDGDRLVPNDVSVTGLIHKIGWRALPSVALAFGEQGDCRGWLVGEEHRGLSYMFQMMNEARIAVGLAGAATASVAYRASLEYAETRTQGRPAGAPPTSPPVPILEHADVRRMLLRQKALCEGAMALVGITARYADVAHAAETPEARERARLVLDLLTPIAKSFPAERGFESNALALQIHGGYGYSSEQLPEAWLRDQKLNSIHEGTTGIQGLDLLGRKAMARGGEALRALAEDVARDVARARAAGVPPAHCDAVLRASETVGAVTLHLGQKGLGGDVDGMLLHSHDYLELVATWVVSWLWLLQAAVAAERLAAGGPHRDLYEGKRLAAAYFLETELPRTAHLAHLCTSGEDSYARMRKEWF